MKRRPVVVAEVDDLQDVRVRQHRGALGLAIEALGQRRVAGHGVVQHLERDLLAEVGLLGEVDATHGAGAEQALDPELLRQEAADQRIGFDGIRHRQIIAWHLPQAPRRRRRSRVQRWCDAEAGSRVAARLPTATSRRCGRCERRAE